MNVLAGLQADGAALSDDVTTAMYAEDPFWTERYGARGRRNADQDGDYHVTYLVEALTAREPALFVRYAVWLRQVLAGLPAPRPGEAVVEVPEAVAADAELVRLARTGLAPVETAPARAPGSPVPTRTPPAASTAEVER